MQSKCHPTEGNNDLYKTCERYQRKINWIQYSIIGKSLHCLYRPEVQAAWEVVNESYGAVDSQRKKCHMQEKSLEEVTKVVKEK